MKRCILFGGAGYIGSFLANRFRTNGLFDEVVIVDVKEPASKLLPGCFFLRADVRNAISPTGNMRDADWIVNLAAVHREPGHEAAAYFDTNVPGATNVCNFADSVGCKNMFFVSSIAVYGPTISRTTEESPNHPTTPYGISKQAAELITAGWQKQGDGRRAIIVRPGVIYGPGDPGNILRMILAVKKGYFIFPGNKQIRKSYGYIEGLVDSFEFMIKSGLSTAIYNYVERDTMTIGELVGAAASFLGVRTPTVSVPLTAVRSAARLIQFVSRGKNAVHPQRVNKAATPTWITPQRLIDLGFVHRFNFKTSLEHWRQTSPLDFQ